MDGYFKFLNEDLTENVDYLRSVKDQGTSIVLVAIHAGGIEPGTGKLAREIAGDRFSFYIFEGLRYDENRELHIPSTKFDDPTCLNVVRDAKVAISIHGCAGSGKTTYIGGRHQGYIEKMMGSLRSHGFTTVHDQTDHAGNHPENICNHSQSNKGVQLELSRGLRKSFFKELNRPRREHPTDSFYRFTSAIKSVL